MTIALKSPTLWLTLIIIQVRINATNQASQLSKYRKVKAKVIVIKNAVKKTCPKLVFFALLKKLNAMLKKIAIINRTIK